MNYIVTTTWSHPNEINKAEMADYQKKFSDRPEVVNMYWFEVDPKTHGSVVVYRDKASYDSISQSINRAPSMFPTANSEIIGSVAGLNTDGVSSTTIQ